MRLLLILLLGVLFQIDLYGQNVIPVEDLQNHWTSSDGYPDDAEFRDVNDLFHPFLGVWETTINAEAFDEPVTLQLHIYENTENFNSGLVIEQLIMKYKIFSEFVTHIDTTNLLDEDSLVIDGIHFDNNGDTFVYSLKYRGVDMQCGQEGQIAIYINNDDETELRFNYTLVGTVGLIFCEGNQLVSQVLPTEPITLIKQ